MDQHAGFERLVVDRQQLGFRTHLDGDLAQAAFEPHPFGLRKPDLVRRPGRREMRHDPLLQPCHRGVRALGDLLAAAHPQVAPDDDDLLGRALPCFLIHEPYRGFEPRTSRHLDRAPLPVGLERRTSG